MPAIGTYYWSGTGQPVTTMTNTTSTTSSTYPIWLTQTSSATTTSASIIWAGNDSTSCTGPVYWTSPIRRQYAPPDHHARLQEVAQRTEIEAHASKAKRRAHKLLLSHLTPEQRRTFEENKWFIVEGGRSKSRYRIRDKGNLVANIDVLDGDRVSHRLCGHCAAGDLPMADHLLAQKMMIEVAEDEFLRIANRHAA